MLDQMLYSHSKFTKRKLMPKKMFHVWVIRACVRALSLHKMQKCNIFHSRWEKKKPFLYVNRFDFWMQLHIVICRLRFQITRLCVVLYSEPFVNFFSYETTKKKQWKKLFSNELISDRQFTIKTLVLATKISPKTKKKHISDEEKNAVKNKAE